MSAGKKQEEAVQQKLLSRTKKKTTAVKKYAMTSPQECGVPEKGDVAKGMERKRSGNTRKGMRIEKKSSSGATVEMGCSGFNPPKTKAVYIGTNGPGLSLEVEGPIVG